MLRKIIAILLAGGGSAGAASVALSEIFGAGAGATAGAAGGENGGFNLEALLAASEQVGASGLGAVLLPVVFFFLRGIQSYLISVVVLTVASVAAVLYFGLAPTMPIVQLATVTGIGSAVAVAVYRIVT